MNTRPGRKSAPRWALLLGTLVPGACSSAAWRDRGHDLAQICEVTTTWGPGMAASVRVTELAQLGFGSQDGWTAGLIEGRWATAREQRSELGASLLHTYEYRRESDDLLDVRQPHYGDEGWDEDPLSWQMESDRRLVDVGLSLHVAWLGFGVTFRPDELFDFLAGCFGADPLEDDAFAPDAETLRRRAQSLDAGTRRRAFDARLRRGEPTHGYAVYTAPDVRPSYQRRALEAVAAESPPADAPMDPPAAPASDPPADPPAGSGAGSSPGSGQ